MSTTETLPCPIAPYVPQSATMCLLESIMAVDENSLRATVTPTRDDPFATADGIPAWTGLEWMAQAIAAWAGWHASHANRLPATGLLIGTKRFDTEVEYFALDSTHEIDIGLDFLADNGLGEFHGVIHHPGGVPMARGKLTIYQSSHAVSADDSPAHEESP